jgi:NAD(P)-dependent dehydrogenase (short-subunit alcohol dehydrogenase family)
MSMPALEHMIERGSGRIINISSITGEIGNIGQANYAASKSGLFGFTKTLAREAAFALARSDKLADDGIGLTVNAVTPGLIETEMTAAVPAKVIESLKAAIPARRMGRPEERPRGGLPGRRCVGLHHRAGLGRQRRPRHVRPVSARVRAAPRG